MRFSALIVILVKVLNASSTLLLTIVVSRMLSVRDAGSFFTSLSIIMILGALSRMGTEQLFVKLGARFYSGIQPMFPGFALFSMAAVITLSVILSFLSFTIPDHLLGLAVLDTNVRTMLLSLACVNLLVLCASCIQGFGLAPLSVFLKFGALPTVVAASIYVYDLHELAGITEIYVVSAACISLLTVFFLVQIWPHKTLNIRLSGEYIIYNLRSAIALWRMSVAVHLTQWGPIVVLSVFDDTGAAQFMIAQRLAMLGSFPLLAVNAVIAPKIAIASQNGEEKTAIDFVLRFVKPLAIYAFLGFLFLLFAGEQVIDAVNPAYKDALPALLVLTFAQLIACITGPFGVFLLMTDHEDTVSRVTQQAALISIFGSILAAGSWGVSGVAIASAAAVIYQNSLLCIDVLRSRTWA